MSAAAKRPGVPPSGATRLVPARPSQQSPQRDGGRAGQGCAPPAAAAAGGVSAAGPGAEGTGGEQQGAACTVRSDGVAEYLQEALRNLRVFCFSYTF